MTAPSARAAKTGVILEGPRGMAASRRAMRARESGPGISVCSCIVVMVSPSFQRARPRRRLTQGEAVILGRMTLLVPADRRFVEIDEDLFRFEIFLETPGAEFAAEAGLL